MKKKKLVILTKDLQISTLQYGYNDLNIFVSNQKPKLKDILERNTFFLIRKDIKQSLGLTLILINILRKRWSKASELKRLAFFNDKTQYKFILPAMETNPIYGSQIDESIINKFNFHTIRLINSNKFNFSLFVLYIISKFNFLKNKKIKSIISINTTNITFLKILKNLFPQSKIYIRFHDPFQSGYFETKNFHKLKKYATTNKIDIESYSIQDANNYKISYFPNGINIKKYYIFTKNIYNNYNEYNKKQSVFFLGTVNKKRLEFLIKVAQTLHDSNLLIKFYFFLDGTQEKINIIKNLNRQLGYSAIEIINFIRYQDYLKLLAPHNIIIDLYRFSTNEGYSFRIPEAVILNKKIITNRQIIQQEAFYSPQNILLIKQDNDKNIINKNNLQIFLKNSNATYSKENVDMFDFNKYLLSHDIK